MQTLKAFLSRNQNMVNGMVALAIVASIALGCNCGKNLDDFAKNASNSGSTKDNPFDDKTDTGIPGDDLLNALVKETTADFASSISTGSFSRMYEKSSDEFKKTYTEDKMKEAFKSFIDKKRALLPVLSKAVSLKPEYSPAPSIRTEKGISILVTTGKYETSPLPYKFEYEYIQNNGRWKMLKVVVDVRR
jgi:hypothetical protein